MTRTPAPNVLSLDQPASTMLDLLVDLGHLDEKLLADVNDRLLDLETPDGIVGLGDVRRVAALVIFDHMGDADPEYLRNLDLEWGLLFH